MLPDAPAVVEELRREQPFRPFEIQTIDGGRYQIGGRWNDAGNERVVSVLGSDDQRYRIPISTIKALKGIEGGV